MNYYITNVECCDIDTTISYWTHSNQVKFSKKKKYKKIEQYGGK